MDAKQATNSASSHSNMKEKLITLAHLITVVVNHGVEQTKQMKTESQKKVGEYVMNLVLTIFTPVHITILESLSHLY